MTFQAYLNLRTSVLRKSLTMEMESSNLCLNRCLQKNDTQIIAGAQALTTAVDNHSIIVNINTVTLDPSPNGQVGGPFMGTTVTIQQVILYKIGSFLFGFAHPNK